MSLSKPLLRRLILDTPEDHLQKAIATPLGAYHKSFFLLLICACSGTAVWSNNNITLILYSLVGLLVFSLLTLFKREWSFITAPINSVFEGMLLGTISSYYNSKYQGIVLCAIVITFVVLFLLLIIYSNDKLRNNSKFLKYLWVFSGSVFLIYFIGVILLFLGLDIYPIDDDSTLRLIFYAVYLLISILLFLSYLDFIEDISNKKYPKSMEWFAAFFLVMSITSFYLDILDLNNLIRSD